MTDPRLKRRRRHPAAHQTPARQQEKARAPELPGVPAAWLLLRVYGSLGLVEHQRDRCVLPG